MISLIVMDDSERIKKGYANIFLYPVILTQTIHLKPYLLLVLLGFIS
jgi:hypothetical protein